MRERRETRGGAVRRPERRNEVNRSDGRCNDMSEPTGMNVVRHEAGTSGVHLSTSVTRRSYRDRPRSRHSSFTLLPSRPPFLRHSRPRLTE